MKQKNTVKVFIFGLIVLLGALTALGLTPIDDSQARLKNIKGFPTQKSAPVQIKQAPWTLGNGGSSQGSSSSSQGSSSSSSSPSAAVPVGDASATFSYGSSQSTSLYYNPVCTYASEWKYIAQWKVQTAGHPLTLNSIPFRVFKGQGASVASRNLAEHYKVIISSTSNYPQSEVASVEVDPQAGYVFLAQFPSGVSLPANSAYRITLMGKSFVTGPGSQQTFAGSAMIPGYDEPALNDSSLGLFSPSTQYESVAARGQNLIFGYTNIALSMDERTAYHPDPACR